MGEESRVVPLSYHASDVQITRHDVAMLAVRLIAVYLLIQVLPFLGFIGMFVDGVPLSLRGEWASVWLMGAVYLSTGIVLFIYADRLASWVLPSPVAGEPLALTPIGRDLQALAFSVVGVILVATAVPNLMQAILIRGMDLTSDELGRAIVASIGDPLAQIIIGSLLFLRARGLAFLWHRTRTAGVRQP